MNQAKPNQRGNFVIYWMTAFRRTSSNFALERAIKIATKLRKPLLIVETLRSGIRWASERHHAFVLQGMADNKAACEASEIRYYPYVEHEQGQAAALIEALAARSCAVVADDYPINSFSEELFRVAEGINVQMERVDSNGLLPMQATDRMFPTAYAFRRFLQRALPDHLLDAPRIRPLARLELPPSRGVPAEISRRWPPASSPLLAAKGAALKTLPIDHAVCPVTTIGGPNAAQKSLRYFVKHKLNRYPEDRNHPDAAATSGLSAYLHFGHVSAFEVFRLLSHTEEWSPSDLSQKTSGKREGWWNMSEAAEAFLDQIVTWREVGFNLCSHSKTYDQFGSLPEWARVTLAEHTTDRRQYTYSLEEFEQASTHDRLWNAAQTQLVKEGHMHNYLRMLWGKKILEWTSHPREAVEVMVELNNKFALDSQDPNSYSGIFWVLGRYDRAWGPVRPVFGKIRYMSSDSAARKLRLKQFLERYAPDPL